MKVFERLVHDQLFAHISKHRLLNPFQSGFRPNHSTATALIDVTDHLYDQRQHGHITGAIFLDLKKAFDTVDPQILLQKILAIGIQETEFKWFSDYFTNRTQKVKIDDATSSSLPITCGVPQGSILGPLLFTLYINDLSGVVKHSKVVLYADDTALFVSGKSVSEIQLGLSEDIDAVGKWLQENKLTLNAKKTKVMMFGSQQRLSRVHEGLEIKINGEILEQVTHFKYLGLWFDGVLNWKHHTDVTSKKIAQRIGIQARIRPFISTATANSLFKSMIAPIIAYGDIVWSKGPLCNVQRIQKLQNRAARVVLRCGRRTHISDMHTSLKWLKCQDSIILHKCLMVGNCLLGTVPSYLRGKFIRASEFHAHSTRRAEDSLFVPRVNTENAKKLFCYEGATLFNKLPPHVRSCSKLRHFKRLCADHFNNNT